jgi:ABC-type uncharacterized transport system substrate-binding protein
MWFACKRLSFGLVLVIAASGVLLLSDVTRKKEGAPPRIAILQQVSIPVLDDGVRGMIDGLAERGFRNGETMELTLYNAEGDLTTANAIARQITDGRFDLVLTSSTVSMQVVANANKAGRTQHVFAIVADPYVAGIGLDRNHPLDHPRHLVGQGVMLPVIDGFRMAKQMLPGLKTVGVASNAAEANSRMFVAKAEEATKELGIELLVAQVENSAGVLEAIQSLVARRAQAIWVGGDTTVSSALDSVLATTRQARIPVFSILPGDPKRGTIIDLGLDFHEAGKQAGFLAADILQGTDPATIPIRDVADVVPRRLMVNQKALLGLREPWHAPPELLREADVVVDEQGVVHEKSDKPKNAK